MSRRVVWSGVALCVAACLAGRTAVAAEALVADVAALCASANGQILYVRAERIKSDIPGAAFQRLPVAKIHAMTGDGKQSRAFIAPEGFEAAENPSWAPDCRSVLFSSNWHHYESCNAFDLFQADVKTGSIRRITGSWQSAGNVIGVGAITGHVIAGHAENAGVEANAVGVLDHRRGRPGPAAAHK